MTGTEDVPCSSGEVGATSGGGKSHGGVAVWGRGVVTAPVSNSGQLCLMKKSLWKHTGHSLRGAAVTVLTNLPPDWHQDYEALLLWTHVLVCHIRWSSIGCDYRPGPVTEMRPLQSWQRTLSSLAYSEAADWNYWQRTCLWMLALPEEDVSVRICQKLQ